MYEKKFGIATVLGRRFVLARSLSLSLSVACSIRTPNVCASTLLRTANVIVCVRVTHNRGFTFGRHRERSHSEQCALCIEQPSRSQKAVRSEILR